MNITMNINIHNYQQLNLKAKLSKQLEEKQSHEKEMLEGYQLRRWRGRREIWQKRCRG